MHETEVMHIYTYSKWLHACISIDRSMVYNLSWRFDMHAALILFTRSIESIITIELGRQAHVHVTVIHAYMHAASERSICYGKERDRSIDWSNDDVRDICMMWQSYDTRSNTQLALVIFSLVNWIRKVVACNQKVTSEVRKETNDRFLEWEILKQ